MDIAQQFCLRWNNYQSTIHHIFNKLFANGTFVDVSIVVEGKRIGCHKVILSACSTYFEQLLSEHSYHPHPLLLIHDIPYSAVQSLVDFMYKGEINVSHDQLTALLKAAETLKIKGLADSAAISNFTKYRLMASDLAKMTNSQYGYHIPTSQSPFLINQNGSVPTAKNISHVREANPHSSNLVNGKRRESSTKSPKPHKKRTRHEDSTTSSLPPSPPISLGENQNAEQNRSSPLQAAHTPEIKIEPEEETDNELQIDESVGQSPSESAESETRSNQNTPGPDIDSQEYDDRTETAKSLAALASQVTPLSLLQHNHHASNRKQTLKIKEERNSGGGSKNSERSYTLQDLEEGIESVLIGHLTPAKAIAKYRIPRRTFFRRLSAVRKSRGIPSSKENASEHFLNLGSALSPASQSNESKNQQIPIVIPGLVSNDSTFLQNITKVSKANYDVSNVKKEKKIPGVMKNTVFSLLNVAANSSYDYYLKYLKLQSSGKEIDSEDKRAATIDGNRNLSSDVPDSALVSQNGSIQ